MTAATKPRKTRTHENGHASAPPLATREVNIVDTDLVLEEEAVREGLAGRIALMGPTGAGKTYSALSIGSELQGDRRLLGIDTERGSMSRYAHDRTCGGSDRCQKPDHFTFARIRWDPPYDPAKLTRVLRQQDAEGRWGCIVIDSLSHFWRGQGGTLDVVDAAKKRDTGNGFAAWKFGDQVQTEMVEAILSLSCHVICCFRVKMAYEIVENERGRKEPRKIGLQPIQRDELEYEYDVIGDLNLNHQLAITKSRCSLIADKVYLPHHEREMGKTLRDWLGSAEADRPVRKDVDQQEAQDRALDALHELGAQDRRNALLAVGYDVTAKAPIGEWVRGLDDAKVQALVDELRLPLTVTPSIPTGGASAEQSAPAPSEESVALTAGEVVS